MAPTQSTLEKQVSEHLARGDLGAAASAAAQCRQAWPTSAGGWLLGSIVALLGGDRDEALALIDEYLRIRPDDAQCLLQRAECLLARNARAAALEAAESAAAHAREVPATLEAVGEFFIQAGEHARAVAIYDCALESEQQDRVRRATLLARRAAAHRILGQFEMAERDYEAVLAIDPVAPKVLKALSELRRQTGERNWIAQMQWALARLPPQSEHAAIVHFGLAKSYQDLGDHAASWRHLSSANRIERALIQYSPDPDRALMHAMEEIFATAQSDPLEARGESPIFIIGLPRCGSTLVEQILSNHPEVQACGELTAMTDAILTVSDRLGDPQPIDARGHAQRLAKLDSAALAQEYLARLPQLPDAQTRWTDKQLINFLYCPLLLRAFPRARIVHVTRHPLAACHAIYRTRFTAGGYPFAYDLTEIAEFYIGYRRLMAHWHHLMPGRILDLPYEALVTGFEPAVRRLLDSVGLPFNGACLEFHRNPAPVITASSVQVRQPLYDSSLDLWKHYGEELTPARTRLEAAGIALD
ncbi:MAG: sulfotransferase [Steroidobacteraceae bacterium]